MPSLELFFALDRTEPFFVKNLENIQGDERDGVISSASPTQGATMAACGRTSARSTARTASGGSTC